MGPGIVGPGSFPIRPVKSSNPPQRVGRCFNSVGKYEMGKGSWPGRSDFEVEKPTRVNGTVRTANSD